MFRNQLKKCKKIKSIIMFGVLAIALFGCKDNKTEQEADVKTSEEISSDQQNSENGTTAENESARVNENATGNDSVLNEVLSSEAAEATTEEVKKEYETVEEGLKASFSELKNEEQKNELLLDQYRHMMNTTIQFYDKCMFTVETEYAQSDNYDVQEDDKTYFSSHENGLKYNVADGIGYDYEHVGENTYFMVLRQKNHSAIWAYWNKQEEEEPKPIPIVEFASNMQCKTNVSKLYYTIDPYSIDNRSEKTSHLYQCDYDGENAKEIISKVTYDWYVFDNAILYVDAADNSTLHICDLNGEKDKKLNNQPSSCPVYDGEYIYYYEEDASWHFYDQRSLWRMSLDGKVNEKLLDNTVTEYIVYGDYIYYTNSNDMDKVYRIRKDGTEEEIFSKKTYSSMLTIKDGRLIYTPLTNYEGWNQNGYLTVDLETGEERLYYYEHN